MLFMHFVYSLYASCLLSSWLTTPLNYEDMGGCHGDRIQYKDSISLSEHFPQSNVLYILNPNYMYTHTHAHNQTQTLI